METLDIELNVQHESPLTNFAIDSEQLVPSEVEEIPIELYNAAQPGWCFNTETNKAELMSAIDRRRYFFWRMGPQHLGFHITLAASYNR